MVGPFKKLLGWRKDELLTDGDRESDLALTGRVSATRDSLFNLSFAEKLRESDDVVSMVANLKFINSILIGMTEFLDDRVTESDRVGDEQYYSSNSVLGQSDE